MPRLLIVDDHEAVRKQLRRVFEQNENYQVCGEASDGLEAVTKFQDARPDVVVMDFNMPGLNGIEASRTILKRAPETPIPHAYRFHLAATHPRSQKRGHQRLLFQVAAAVHHECCAGPHQWPGLLPR